jgi:hypothetical protein
LSLATTFSPRSARNFTQLRSFAYLQTPAICCINEAM